MVPLSSNSTNPFSIGSYPLRGKTYEAAILFIGNYLILPPIELSSLFTTMGLLTSDLFNALWILPTLSLIDGIAEISFDWIINIGPLNVVSEITGLTERNPEVESMTTLTPFTEILLCIFIR